MKRHEEPVHQLCGPDCKYRALYEGSQRTLTDMASAQAASLGRVGRLRSSIIMSLKRTVPVEFNEAERSLKSRLSDIDDELLGAYLESFLASLVERSALHRRDMARVRSQFERLGIALDGSVATLSDLADALGALGGGKVGLDALFDDDAADRANSEIVAQTSRGLDRDHSPTGAVGVAVSGTSMSEPEVVADSSLDELFDDDYGADAEPSSSYDERGWEESSGLLHGDAPSEAYSSGVRGEQDGHLHEGATADPDDAEVPRAPAEVVRAPWAMGAAEGRTGGPLRPSLAPPVTKTRVRKPRATVRASVTPGEEASEIFDSATQPTELNDEVRAQLSAAVCIPRPVFGADLVALVGDGDIVADWVGELNSPERDLTVRFVAPKTRHKQRGPLVYPANYLESGPADFRRSLWARCLSYRGAKLYEMGVLLHRYLDEVVSDELGSEVVILRMARPQGLVGVVVVLESTLGEGESTRGALVEALEKLMRERLVQIAILSTNAEIVDTITAVVEDEAWSKKWVPAMPVTLSRSWEFAAGTGVALPLLGA